MKRYTQSFAIFLAALLQFMPLLRNILTVPTASSTMAIILRWTIGSSAAIGAYDAYSAASGTYMNTSSNITGTVGVAMNFTNNFVINGGPGNVAATGDGFILQTAGGTISSGFLTNAQSTSITMPSGLTFKCFSINNATNIYGVISGTPTGIAKTNINISAVYAPPTGGGYVFATNISITISAAVTVPPVITNQPANVTTNVGNFVNFSVTNGGTAPFKYQWFFNTNTALVNYTNSSMTVTNVQLTNAGTYSVAITNSAGSTNSTFALLTVWQPPVITNQPAGVTNVAGATVTFSQVADGSPTPAYQWKFNGSTILPNATNASLTLTNIRASQAGTYSVTTTNLGGVTNSVLATLGVTNPLPTTLSTATNSGGVFKFTFIPTIGLTNSVLTNSVLTGGVWAVLTNVPPPASASPITVTDALGSSNRFYRVSVQP